MAADGISGDGASGDGASAARVSPAAALLSAIREGRTTVADAAAACLNRVDAREDEVGAWTHIDRDRLMADAEALDRHKKAGRPIGPLHGLPVGVKDIIDVRGMPCEYGSAIEAGRRPTADATVIRRLRNAGALIVGKTVTTEFAYFSPGKTRNPNDTSRTPGGSSSGSAAAVADGHVPFALGTQTKGSVIRPASFCGVVGYKPSLGAVPRTGVMPDAPSFDTVGAFAASVEDVALLEHAMGPDGQDRAATGSPGPMASVVAAAPPMAPALAFVKTPAWEAATEATKAGFAELSDALGGIMSDVALPAAFNSAAEWQSLVMAVEMAKGLGAHADKEPDQVSDQFGALVDEGRKVLAHDYLVALDWQKTLRAGVETIFERFDAIVTPAAPGEAPGPETTGDPAFCTLWSFTGHPAVSLPLLTGPDGLPVGVQLVGAMGDDARLLRTARWLINRIQEDA